MASVRQTRYGTWEVHYRDPLNRQRSKTFRRKSDARQFAAEVDIDVRRGNWTPPEDERRLFGDLAEEWLSWIQAQGRKPRTVASYRQYLDAHVLPALGRRPVVAIDRPAVRRFAGELAAKGLAPASVRKVIAIVRQVLGLAEENRIIRGNPAANLRLSSPRTNSKIRFLTAVEVEALADAIESPPIRTGGGEHRQEHYPEFGLLVRFAAYTGLRAGEIAGLQVADVDVDAGTVRVARVLGDLRRDVRGEFPVLQHKGRTYPGLFLDTTKTDRIRVVPVPATVLVDLATHVEGRDGDDFVFRMPWGGPMQHANFYRRYFRPAVRRTGLDGLRFHDMRHTYASLLIAQGANPKTVMERLGHSTVQMTLNVYGHLFPHLEAEITNALDAGIAEARAQRRRTALQVV